MDGSLWGDYLKTMLLLAGIVLLAWAALRFWLPRTAGFRQMGAGPVRVVARYPLEPRKTLYIVTVGSELSSRSGGELDPDALAPRAGRARVLAVLPVPIGAGARLQEFLKRPQEMTPRLRLCFERFKER